MKKSKGEKSGFEVVKKLSETLSIIYDNEKKVCFVAIANTKISEDFKHIADLNIWLMKNPYIVMERLAIALIREINEINELKKQKNDN